MKKSEVSTKKTLNLQGGSPNLNAQVLRKTKLKPQEGKLTIQETEKSLIQSRYKSLYIIERIGFLLILLSGLTPFVHSFIEPVKLESKFFGFSSLHSFAYSFGVHLSTFLLVVGILLVTSIVQKPERYRIIQKYIKLCMISPFISVVFYLSWVFVPNVDYNLLSYIFLALFISVVSLVIFVGVLKYINTLKIINQHKEKVVSDGMNYIKSKLSK